MASKLKTSETPTAKAMDRAIEMAIQGNSPYPARATFVDADSPHAGKLIERAVDGGCAVVLVSADGGQRVLTGGPLAT